MAIERKCENCIYFGMKSQNGMECCLPTDKEWNLELCNYANFTPKEEVIREDERKNITDLILNSKFYIKDNDKTYEVLVNELKPKTIDTFEKSIRQEERNKVFEELANSENICFKYNGETYHITVEKEI